MRKRQLETLAWVCLFISAFFHNNITAQEITSFNLDEAVHYAMEHNMTLKNATIDIKDAEEQILESRAIGLPKISFGVNYQHFIIQPVNLVPAQFFGGNAGEFREITFGTKNNLAATLDARTMIFDKSFFTGLQAARTYRSFASQQMVQRQKEIRDKVQAAYLPPLIIKESIKTLEKNITNLKKLVYETTELYKEGFAEQLDIDRLELSLANLETDLGNLTQQKTIALNKLRFLMGYPLNKAITLTDVIDQLFVNATELDLTDPLSFLSHRPDYRLAELGIVLQRLNVELQRAKYFPSLSAFGRYQQNATGDKILDPIWLDQAVVGLQLNIPLFDGLGKKAKINRANLELERSKNQLRELERVIFLEVNNARILYSKARKKLTNQKKNLELAERIYETTQIKYQEGIGSSLEITMAEQDLFRSQQNLIQTKYELLQAKMELDKALGK